MDLFESSLEQRFDEYAPLAARMRPRTVEEIVGQSHILGSGRALRSLIEAGDMSSIILWGPAGTGKTTLAHLLAHAVGAELIQLSAVSSGVAAVARRQVRSMNVGGSASMPCHASKPFCELSNSSRQSRKPNASDCDRPIVSRIKERWRFYKPEDGPRQ